MQTNGTTETQTKKRGLSRVNLLIILCWLVYTCSYIGKLSYSANMKQMEGLFHVDHATTGMVSTFFFFAYGAGQIINGFCCKKYHLKYVVFGALIVSAICNLLAGTLPWFGVIKYVWLVNGAAMSVLWPSLIRLLSETLSKKDVARSVVAMGTTTATGTFMVYGLSAGFVALGIFRTIFFVSAIFLPCVALLWIFSYNRLVFPLKKERMEEAELQAQADAALPVKKGKLSGGLFVVLAILALFAVSTNLIKEGLTSWVPSILIEEYALPEGLSIVLTLLLPVLAIFGAIMVTKLHKKITDFVTLCAVLFIAAGGLIGVVIGFLHTDAFIVTLISMALVSCAMAGVNNVVTNMFPLYMKEKVNSGMIAGVLNGFCYLGSMLSTYGLGKIADTWNWLTVFWVLLVVCILAVTVGVVYGLVSLFARKRK